MVLWVSTFSVSLPSTIAEMPRRPWDAITKYGSGLGSRPALRRNVDLLLPYESFSEKIASFWIPHAQHHDASWQAHQNINDVMLATALLPDMFLSVGKWDVLRSP